MRLRASILMLLALLPLSVCASVPVSDGTAHAHVSSSIAPTVSATYDIKVETKKTINFSAAMSITSDSASNPMSITRDSGYVKSVSCCTKDPKTGLPVTDVVPGIYTTGVSLNVSMVKADPNLLSVRLDIITDEGLKTFTPDNGNGYSIQLPSVHRDKIDTVVRLDSKGRGSFHLGNSTVTVTKVDPDRGVSTASL